MSMPLMSLCGRWGDSDLRCRWNGDFKSGIAPLIPAIALDVVLLGCIENFKHNVRQMGLEDFIRKNLPDFNKLPIDYCVFRFDGRIILGFSSICNSGWTDWTQLQWFETIPYMYSLAVLQN